MKTIKNTLLIIIAWFVLITIAFTSCSKSKCYQCSKTLSNGNYTEVDKCFDKKDKREYVKKNIDSYEANGYKCRAKVLD